MNDHPAGPTIVSVNVGTPREITWQGRRVRTAIWKHPVDSTEIRGVSCVGDEQADLSVHGGPDKAVYAYALEDLAYWALTEGLKEGPGLFGENLTTRGLDVSNAVVGERWQVGTAVLEVRQPRLPCFKLGIRVGDDRFPKRFLAALRLGAYLGVVQEGTVKVGDAIQVIHRPDHAVTVRLLGESLQDERKSRAILVAPELPASWRARAAKMAGR